ncbi:hypothetical protein DID76_00495 [Candidatus Marinamargulisbacteria bacterium SCGC AG-414-C22]|nr:hypothetical protein DID76_00495 [Candidatus Marinamargulisbacteria bacterium SCGC AG-414-C22]
MKPIKLEEYVISQSSFSRRKYFELLKQGKVSVDGNPIYDISYELTSMSQKVVVAGKHIAGHVSYRYFMFHKPKGMLSTMSDTNNRSCIGDMIRENNLNVSPVGRLDRLTTGLMILTNDGELAHKLMHPKHHVKKVYNVTLDKVMIKQDYNRLVEGVILEDGPVQCHTVELVAEKTVQVTISEGRNRIVRRLFDHLGYDVQSLKRIGIGSVLLGDLGAGKYKKLSPKQLNSL